MIYFRNQITCNNTGQVFNDGHTGKYDADIDAPEAWDISTGCNDIIIAVLDMGVTSDHTDLPNSRQVRLPGSNFGYGISDDPSPNLNQNHGNACAGVIGATMDNNEGIAGIAPNCRIMPIKVCGPGDALVSPVELANAIKFAADNGADILSNSWGLGNYSPGAFDEIEDAITYAQNKNCVVIFSTGNSANHVDDSDGYVAYPANVNIQGVITVGASDRYDKQANYSPSSNLIDIVATSNRARPDNIVGETMEMWTLDIPGEEGDNPWPGNNVHPPIAGERLPNDESLAYTGRFGGTSHSCPVVAGVAALVLSINPNLSYMDVYNILTSTADKVGGYTYTNGHSNELGYGRVNANKALKAVYPITGPSTICGNTYATFTISGLPGGASVYWTKSSNVSYISGQNTTSYKVKRSSAGYGWVQANISGVSCSTVKVRMKFADGRPNVTDSQIRGGSGNVPVNSTDQFFITEATDATSYVWSIVPYSMSCSSSYLPYIIGSNNTTSVRVKHGSCIGKYMLKCKAVNSCGYSYYQDRVISVYSSSGGGGGGVDPCAPELTVYPNPAKKSDFTTLRIQQPPPGDDPCDEYPEAYSQEKNDIQVFDLSGNMVIMDSFNSDTYTFSNAGFKKQVYVITVTDKKGRVHQKRFTVKK